MYILRWLMKNPLIMLAAFLLLCFILIYSFSGGDDEAKRVDTNVDTNSAPKTEIANKKDVDVDLSKAPKIEPSKLTNELVGGKADEKADTAQTDVKTVKADDTNAPAETQQASSEATNKAPAQALTSSAQGNSTAAPQTVADSTAQFDEANTDELLLMAREAYWNNGLEESAELYQQLIKANPDVIDYKGELGNVYWRQGMPEKAAALYAEISMPMIEAGNTARVANMVGFIGLFFPEKATEIHNKLQAVK